MATKFFSLCCFCLSVMVNAFCQPFVNLVPNPSFEDFQNGCPANFHEMPLHWTWWRESPNSFSTCVQPQNLFDSLGWAPWNGFGYQEPASGNSYVGAYAFSPDPFSGNNFREYLGCELTEPLVVGETYYVSFKTSLGLWNYYWVLWACSHVGLIFTTQGYQHPNNPMPIPNFAHVYSKSIIADTANWVTVSGTVVADKPYTHLGLGVFFEQQYLDTLRMINIPGQSGLGAYYYFDDVCVSSSSDCLLASVKGQSKPRITLFPNPSEDWVSITGLPMYAKLRLFGSNGQLVLLHDWTSSANKINISGLPEGIYVAEITTTKEQWREKLVIVRQ